MADRKSVSSEQLKPLLEAIAKEEYNPKNLASKIGSRDNISDRRIQIRDFLNSLDGSDTEAKELLSSLKDRTDKALKVAGSQYSSSKKAEPTNFDKLNEGGAVKISAKDDAAKILEQRASQIDPLEYKIQQNRGVATPNIMDVQQVDIAGAKKQALENLLLNPKTAKAEEMVAKAAGKMPKARAGGKLGALMAIGNLGYQALKGEPVMAQDVLRSGAELVNPLPFSMEELGEESKKMQDATSPERVQEEIKKLNEQKEQEKQNREASALPGALEFGDNLQEMQQNQAFDPMMSPRKQEIKRRLRGY